MIIKPVTGGMFGSISYLVSDKGRAVLIDAGVDSEKVVSTAKEANLTIEKIILTHGHIDHIAELDNIVQKTNAEVYIHIDESIIQTGKFVVPNVFTGETTILNSKYKTLKDGDIINVGDLEFKVIYTPGHTPGSICLLSGKTLFSGDTLFNSGYGRIDLPHGNFEYIYDSIMNKLFKLPDDILVFPGHGDSTTIGQEKKTNPIKYSAQW